MVIYITRKRVDSFCTIELWIKEMQVQLKNRCQLTVMCGTIEDAKRCFLNCEHYIISRTFWAVMFSSLADQFGIEVISGTDSNIQFKKQRNMVKEKDYE